MFVAWLALTVSGAALFWQVLSWRLAGPRVRVDLYKKENGELTELAVVVSNMGRSTAVLHQLELEQYLGSKMGPYWRAARAKEPQELNLLPVKLDAFGGEFILVYELLGPSDPVKAWKSFPELNRFRARVRIGRKKWIKHDRNVARGVIGWWQD